MEEASVKRKLANLELQNVSINESLLSNGNGSYTTSTTSSSNNSYSRGSYDMPNGNYLASTITIIGGGNYLNSSSHTANNHHHHHNEFRSNNFSNYYNHASHRTPSLSHLIQRKPLNGESHDNLAKLNERLRELESERKELDKLRKSSAFQRNFVYPLAMLLLLFFTGITVLLVVQNTLELLIGIKALPLSTRQFTLGISSLSKLGPIGAGLEVCLIFYLGATSAVGFYTMPFMRNVRPQRRKTSLSQLILNCALVLILSSALPLLSRIIGITNFDLLGDFGAIEWLGNFQIVLLYNLVFGTTTALVVANKFTATVRQELCARLSAIFTLG
uniref:LMBR1-like membrane protein n=1 Tax=Musca domestica TaxID=7370 RepID=T1PKN2_MUSDO